MTAEPDWTARLLHTSQPTVGHPELARFEEVIRSSVCERGCVDDCNPAVQGCVCLKKCGDLAADWIALSAPQGEVLCAVSPVEGCLCTACQSFRNLFACRGSLRPFWRTLSPMSASIRLPSLCLKVSRPTGFAGRSILRCGERTYRITLFRLSGGDVTSGIIRWRQRNINARKIFTVRIASAPRTDSYRRTAGSNCLLDIQVKLDA